MNQILKKISAIALLMCLLILLSCSTNTQLYERWNDAQYNGPSLKKVLVVGIFKDDIQRRLFESTFVEAVDAKGKSAVASYALLTQQTEETNKQLILEAVEKISADAVLITSFNGVIEKQREVPGRVDYVPQMGMSYGRYGYGYRGYYGSRYDTIYRPGYTVTDKIVQLETRVYSVADEKLVWAGKTKSINASSAEGIVKDLVNLVVKDMKTSRLID